MIPLFATSRFPFWIRCGMILGLDHCEAAGACKSESTKNGGVAPVLAAGCEANHTHLTEFALICGSAVDAPVSRDRTNECAADGLLVVPVRRLGTVSRKIPKAGPPLIRRRDDGRILAHPLSPMISRSGRCRGVRKCCVGTEASTRPPNGSARREMTRLNSINKANATTVKMRG